LRIDSNRNQSHIHGEGSTKGVFLAIGMMLLFFALPLHAQTVTAAQKAEIEKTLSDATKEMSATINQLSTAGMTKYLSADFQEHIWSGGFSPSASGKDAYLKSMVDTFSQRTSQKFDMDSLKVFVLAADSAYFVMTGGVTVTLKSGRHGGWGWAGTFIWWKEPSGWKIIHFHESIW
jgi:hypothetical protein